MKIGETYRIQHERKGRFWGKIMSVDGEWCDVLVIDGVARAMQRENEAHVGEVVRVRTCMATFTHESEVGGA